MLAILALMSVSCGSANEAVQAAARTVAPSSAASPSTIPATTAAPPTSAVEIEVSLLSGRDAIAANSGKAHVLWFWGAH